MLPDFQIDKADLKLSDSDAVKIGDSELPDWLSQIPQTEAAATGQELPILSEEISPAELPTWLKAMKPSEPRSASFTDASVFQQTGPLAGLPEILPSTESKLDFPASVLHTGKLLITESQQQSADIISTMLDKIGEAATVKPVGKSITRRWMRPVIAVLLLVVIAIPLILGMKTSGNVSTLPVAGEAAYAILENLADESPVLIAFEYEPAFSGELTLAGSAILQQLAIKQTRLVFVSTTSAGPILADTLLQSSLDDLAIRYREDDVSYLLDNRVVNLGYLAGSTTSLQEFARNPRQAARNGLKAALDGVPTWSHPALSNIDSLDDFALVIVLTDSSETGRTWVEQVEPNLADTPLVMVASSLAAPMLQPYYQSAQIDGLLAGIRDGSSYQSKLFSNGIGNSRSAALQFAVILVSLIIFIGMLIFGIQAVLANRRKE